MTPFRLAGGLPGALGINRIERADGRRETLRHIGSAEMARGDVFIVETPGGGGYGETEVAGASGAGKPGARLPGLA